MSLKRLLKIVQKKDNLIIRFYSKLLKSLEFRKYTFSVVRPKARLLSYYKIRAILAFLLCLVIVRQYDLEASPVIQLEAIAQIESSGRSNAIGDGGKALGKFQIHFPLIQDYNRYNRTQYTHKDALKPITAQKIADWALHTYFPKILRQKGYEPTLDSVLTCYNMGCGAVLKGRKATAYIAKYRRLTSGKS